MLTLKEIRTITEVLKNNQARGQYQAQYRGNLVEDLTIALASMSKTFNKKKFLAEIEVKGILEEKREKKKAIMIPKKEVERVKKEIAEIKSYSLPLTEGAHSPRNTSSGVVEKTKNVSKPRRIVKKTVNGVSKREEKKAKRWFKFF